MHRRNRRAAAIIPDRDSWIAGKLSMQPSRESGCVEPGGGIGVDCSLSGLRPISSKADNDMDIV